MVKSPLDFYSPERLTLEGFLTYLIDYAVDPVSVNAITGSIVTQ